MHGWTRTACSNGSSKSAYVQGKPALLCLDTLSGHLTEEVKKAFQKCRTKLLLIPGGCTSILQPLDISINKPFKPLRATFGSVGVDI